VDCPLDGLRPDAHACQLLELFAVQAALALDHAHARPDRAQHAHHLRAGTRPDGAVRCGPATAAGEPAYCAFLGRRLEDLVGMQVKELLHADGSTVWGRLSLTPLHTGYGETHVLAQLGDITTSRVAALDLERRATTDSLTGLDNHAALMAHLKRTLQAPGRTAVLYCDVGHFKHVNDTLGHPAGDGLLVEIAERSRQASSRVINLLGPGEDRTLVTSMTVGVALGDSGTDVAALLAAADHALLTAKREGRDRVVLA
jgi:GGDEF domain-containing protein